jgi:hypothetical protein
MTQKRQFRMAFDTLKMRSPKSVGVRVPLPAPTYSSLISGRRRPDRYARGPFKDWLDRLAKPGRRLDPSLRRSELPYFCFGLAPHRHRVTADRWPRAARRSRCGLPPVAEIARLKQKSACETRARTAAASRISVTSGLMRFLMLLTTAMIVAFARFALAGG